MGTATNRKPHRNQDSFVPGTRATRRGWRWWSDAVRYRRRWPGGFWRRINFAQQLRVVCERKRTFIKKKKRCNKQRTIYLKKAKRISQTQSDSDQSQLHVSYTSSPLSTAWATEAEIPPNPYQEHQDVNGSDCSRSSRGVTVNWGVARLSARVTPQAQQLE